MNATRLFRSSRFVPSIKSASRLAGCTAALLLLPLNLMAESGTWLGTTDASWNGGNWSGLTAPGSGETATFNGTGNGNTAISLGTGVTVGSIIFDSASAASYALGQTGQTLTFDAPTGNAVTINAGVTNNQTIGANVLINNADNTLRLVNSGSGLLTIDGTIQGGTAAAKVLNLTGNITLNGAVNAGAAASMAVANIGTSTVTFSGSGTSNLLTLRAGTSGASSNGGSIVVDGQTVNVSASSSYGSNGGRGTFEIKSGEVNFNGGMTTASNTGDGNLFKISGGTFTASSVFMHRTWGNSGATATTAAPTTSGFVVTGGTASITGVLDLAGSNSNTSGLVSGGSLTVDGEVRIGNSTSGTGRFFVFQVSGGRFTSTNTGNGIVLSRSGTNANNSSLYLTGGTSTAEKISFGISTTASGSTGTLTMNGANAALYLGSGGLVKGAVNTYTESITLTQGLLGAKASWSSSLNMNLNGAAFNIKAADETNAAHDISLAGSLSGTGGFNKSGSGTLALNGTNNYTGATTVEAGRLLINNITSGTSSVSVSSGATLGGSGSLSGGTASSISLGSGSFLLVGTSHGSGGGAAQSFTLGSASTATTLTSAASTGFQFDLLGRDGLPTDNDILYLAGASGSSVMLEGILQVSATTALEQSWQIGDSWKLIDWALMDAGSTPVVNLNVLPGQMPDLASINGVWEGYTGTDGFYIRIAAVPEPGRPLMLALALTALVLHRRRGTRPMLHL